MGPLIRTSIVAAAALLAAGAAYIVLSTPSPPAAIRVLGEDSANLKALSELNQGYETQLGTTIKIEPAAFEVAFQKSTNDFANHTGAYDIVLQYNFSLSSFVRNNYVIPLDELKAKVPDQSIFSFEKDLFPNTWKETGFYFKQPFSPESGIQAIGYPFAANTMLLVYNKKMFSDPENQAAYEKEFGEPLSVPKTWDQLEHVAKFFTNPNKGTYGIALEGAAGGWLYYEWCDLFFGSGGKLMDKEYGWASDLSTPLNLDSPIALDATQRYLRLKPYNAGDFYSISASEQRQLMLKGNVALAIMWTDYLFDMVQKPDKSFRADFGFAPIPGAVSMLAGGIYYVNRDSKHQTEAIKYIALVMQRQNQLALVRRGLASPLRSVYSDPSVQNIPYIPALRESLNRGVYMAEAGPDADIISNALTRELQRMWRGELNPKQALLAAKRDIETERAQLIKKSR
jgi:ABC-type glycerol-3-phosphate transport system substrate-binding protein